MLRLLATAALVLAAMGSAHADNHSGGLDASDPTTSSFYAVGRGAASFARDTQFGVGALGIATVENDYSTGYMALLGIGYSGGNGIRAELDVSYTSTDISFHTANLQDGTQATFGPADSFGKASSFAVMASGYYDIDFGTRLTPFVGAGIGYGRVDADGFGVTGIPNALDDADWGVAYQFTAGATIDVMQDVAFEVGYRYQGVDTDLGGSVDFDAANHNLFVGLRFGF